MLFIYIGAMFQILKARYEFFPQVPAFVRLETNNSRVYLPVEDYADTYSNRR